MTKPLSIAFLTALTTTAAAQPADEPPPTEPPPEQPKKVEPPPAPPPQPVAAVSAPASSRAQGWNEPYAVLFSLNNVLQVSGVLSEFQGLGVAFQKHRSSTSAIRAGVRLLRNAAPQQVTKTTTRTGTDTISVFAVAPGTSTWDVLGSVDLLKRMSEKKISPYMGIGVFLGYHRTAQYLDDDLSVTDQLHTIDERDINVVGGGRGSFGVAWRVHDSFEIFAEYALTIPVFTHRDFSSTDALTDTANDATMSETSQTKTTSWLNFDVGLVQGASFGLAVMF